MKEEYQFIQNFHKGIIEDQIFLESTVKGCNKFEISKIEHKLKQSLPRSIKEFLSFCGKQWKGIYALHLEFLTIVDIKISQEMIKFKTNLSDVKN